ncbi:hypothetical protein P692DRAFT_20739588 [Suillus brevipes Sb2]|nr:hypothetical protein P692DRAFT_20739588 [Suillus brevipes Sb2]
MTPKYTSKATSKAPTKKAKASGILSDILCLAPGVVSINSMMLSMNQLWITSFMQESPIKSTKNILFSCSPILSKNISTIGPTPTTTTTTALASPTRPIHVGSFCHFCCDSYSPPHQHKCIECSAIICKQFFVCNSGCIFFNSIDTNKKMFLCPVYSRSS